MEYIGDGIVLLYPENPIPLLELRRKAQGMQEICYWKNRQGYEVDFVVMEGTAIVANPVKFNENRSTG